MTVYEDANEITDQGGFNLRKWNSNDKEVLSAIITLEVKRRPMNHECKMQVSEESQSCVDSAVDPSNRNDKTKLLGVNWDSDSDRIYFDVQHVIDCAKSLPPTKRSLLKLAAKIFDPKDV